MTVPGELSRNRRGLSILRGGGGGGGIFLSSRDIHLSIYIEREYMFPGRFITLSSLEHHSSEVGPGEIYLKVCLSNGGRKFSPLVSTCLGVDPDHQM